jgi:hypothetical protein
MTLIEKMLRVAEMWASAQGHSSTSRLSNIVANDGRVLAKLGEGGGATISTIDKFVVYLSEPGNWPEAAIPREAAALLASIGPITTLPEQDAA